MKTTNKSPLAAAMGIAFISSVSATAVYAEANPFGMTELSSGYMQVAEASKAAEMACGASMNMATPKGAEGACAAKKTDAKATEGKCGEGKCGGMMDGDKMKKGMESSCGAMMKGKEGACGTTGKMAEGKCGSACGEHMKSCPDAKTKEGACGAAMKGCGEGMQGCTEMMKSKEGGCAANVTPAHPATPAVPAKK
ncbi:hypothetical protein JCM14076_03780 [Methylosoma difficile]